MSINTMKLALEALEAVSKEMTVGERYTDAGQLVLDALEPLREALSQQPTTPEPVMDVRCEGCGYMTHHREHMGCVRAAKQHTHPATSVPDDVVRDAERYRFIRDADVSDDLIPDVALYALESLDEYIDAAMLATKDTE